MSDATTSPPASEKPLLMVQDIRSHIPGWRRSLSDSATEATDKTPDYAKLRRLLHDPDSSAPREFATNLQAVAQDAGTTPKEALGQHAHLLKHALNEAAKWWDSAIEAVSNNDASDVQWSARSAMKALDAAMQHALFLTFLDDVRKGHTAQSRRIDDYAQGWGLSSGDIDTLWAWLLQDPREFDGEELPIAPDSVNRCAYRRSECKAFTWFTAAALVWAAVLVFVLVVSIFALLHRAGLTSWPSRWEWKMLVLLLFVSLGAIAHIGARGALDVNFDDPMKVYDAGNIIEWLSLRWVAVLRMYVPVAVVVACLWGAGNIPTSFQDLGTAFLAGYGADSFLRSALSKLQTSAPTKPQQAADN
ncbi:MAG TPA: hypothetical protein VII53_05080 [Solirubrobacteraceae bacterium]